MLYNLLLLLGTQHSPPSARMVTANNL